MIPRQPFPSLNILKMPSENEGVKGETDMRLFDLHCDTLYRAFTENGSFNDRRFHISYDRAGDIAPYIQCMAVWIPDEYRGEAAWELFSGCVDKLKQELEEGIVIQCRSSDDIRRLEASGGRGIVLTAEGGAVLGGKLERVRELSDAGVRMLTLTWNGANELGDGVGVENAGGLTEFGRAVIPELEKNHIIIDVSHASQRLFYDVAALSERPFVASHSDAMSITPHRRNLTDEQFCIIRQKGGIVGLNFCRDFLNKQATNAKMCDIIRNAEHFLALGGEKTVAIGGDLDGADIPVDMRGIESLPELYEMFLHHNYNEELVRDIFFNNALSFFSRYESGNSPV